jgi:hypothetical protein
VPLTKLDSPGAQPSVAEDKPASRAATGGDFCQIMEPEYFPLPGHTLYEFLIKCKFLSPTGWDKKGTREISGAGQASAKE